MLRDSNCNRPGGNHASDHHCGDTRRRGPVRRAAPLHAKDNDASVTAAKQALKQAVAGPQRTEANRARDPYRHPVETLSFFGVKPKDTVVELWPGGGWYTEILAPYLAEKGTLIAAAPAGKGAESMAKRFDANPALFGKVQRANFPTVLGGTGVAPGTADVVLTFRNVHNWKMGYMQPDKSDYSEAAFREIYAMLKPGGVLGIEDHRLPESASAERERDERLHQGVDRPCARGESRVQVRRRIRGQCQPEGHDGLAGRRVDPAADVRPRRQRQGEVRGHRRKRPHDVAVREAQALTGAQMITLTVNGIRRTFDGDPTMPLLWFLRDELALTGTKYGCGIAQCGACTVHVDGTPVRACQRRMSDARADAPSRRSKGCTRRASTRCRWPGARSTCRSAASARAGQIMQAAALLAAQAEAHRRRHRRGDERAHLPLRHLSTHSRGDQGRGGEAVMSAHETAVDLACAARPPNSRATLAKRDSDRAGIRSRSAATCVKLLGVGGLLDRRRTRRHAPARRRRGRSTAAPSRGRPHAYVRAGRRRHRHDRLPSLGDGAGHPHHDADDHRRRDGSRLGASAEWSRRYGDDTKYGSQNTDGSTQHSRLPAEVPRGRGDRARAARGRRGQGVGRRRERGAGAQHDGGARGRPAARKSFGDAGAQRRARSPMPAQGARAHQAPGRAALAGQEDAVDRPRADDDRHARCTAPT